MEGAANNPAFAKKVGVPQSVAKEFVGEDKGGKLPERKTRAERWYSKKD